MPFEYIKLHRHLDIEMMKIMLFESKDYEWRSRDVEVAGILKLASAMSHLQWLTISHLFQKCEIISLALYPVDKED